MSQQSTHPADPGGYIQTIGLVDFGDGPVEALIRLNADTGEFVSATYTTAVQVDEDDYEVGTPDHVKVRSEREIARDHQRHVATTRGDERRFHARQAASARATARRIEHRLTTTTTIRPQSRQRGAGRPRAAATRSSVRSGDSGDDGPAQPRLGAIAERRVRTLLEQVQKHQPATVEAIRNLPRLAWYLDEIYLETLDAAIAQGRLVEGPTGRPVALIGVIA